MAAGQHNPSRRALLGAVVAMPLASSFPRKREPKTTEGQSTFSSAPKESGTPDQVRGDGTRWQRALARVEAAEAEMRAVERATAGKSAEEEEALQEVYDARLGEHTAALLRLMKVRAPDLPALALKIELAIDQEVGTLTGGELCLAILKRDVRRLMK